MSSEQLTKLLHALVPADLAHRNAITTPFQKALIAGRFKLSSSQFQQLTALLSKKLSINILETNIDDYSSFTKFTNSWWSNVAIEWEQQETSSVWLTEDLSNPLRLESCLRKGNFLQLPPSVHIQSVSTKLIGVGEGFLSKMSRVTVTYTQPGPYPTSFIAKLTPLDADFATRVRVRASKYLKSEAHVYRHLMERRDKNKKTGFVSVGNSNDDDELGEAGFHFATLFYAAYDPILDRSTLLLEDLSVDKQGRVRDQLEGHDLLEMQQCLDYAAAFHALFYGVVPADYDDPETGLNFVRDIVGEPKYLKFNGEKYRSGIEAMKELNSELGFSNNSQPSQCLELFAIHFEQYLSAWRPCEEIGEDGLPGKYTGLTICHGDLRADNIFFCQNRTNGRKEVPVPIDYQGIRRCPPELDLAYFLTQSVTVDIRRQHEGKVLRRYHNQMTSYLKNQGQSFYSLEVMLAVLQVSVVYANRIALLLTGIASRIRDPNVSERGDSLFLAMYRRSFTAMEEWGSLKAVEHHLKRGNRLPTRNEALELLKGTALDGVLRKSDLNIHPSLSLSSTSSAVLLISDIDGTMIGDEQALLNFNKIWLNVLKPKGSVLVYNTSRSLDSFRRLKITAKSPILIPDIFIGNNGCTVCTFANGNIEEPILLNDFIFDSFNINKVRDIINNVSKNIFGSIPSKPIQPDPITGSSRETLLQKKSFMLYQRDDTPNCPHRICVCMRTENTKRDAKLLDENLLIGFAEQGMQVYVNTSWVQMTQSKEKRASGSKNSDMALVDCVPVEAGKGNATRWVREKFGFPCERTMVAGDGFNDVPMFWLSGTEKGVLVGNCEENVVEMLQKKPIQRLMWAKGYFAAAGIIYGLKSFGFVGVGEVENSAKL